MSLTTNRHERLDPGTMLMGADGRRLVVTRSSRHGRRWVVTFRGVEGIEAAGELRGAELFAEPIEDPDALWVHDVVGAEVVDTGGTPRGRVVSVQQNPASDLLELDTGHLVPARFIVEHEPGRRVVVDAPDGLFDLG